MRDTVLVIASGFLYGISFVLPKICFLCVWISTAMLFMINLFSFTHAFMWGIIAYGIQLHGLVPGVITLAPAAGLYAWLPGIFLILHLAGITALWWSISSWCEQCIQKRYRLMFRVLWLSSYWLFITYGCLFFYGRLEGCLLANPIIPCATNNFCMHVASSFGVGGATLFFCMVCALTACAFVYQKYYRVIVIIGLFMLMNYRCVFIQNHESRNAFVHVGIVQEPIISSLIDDASVCNVVSEYVACAYARNPELTAILFPESSVYPWKICAESILAEYMPTKKSCDYIIGSFYRDGDAFRNSCYWLRNGVVQKRFDKRHAMPLIERLPWFLQYSFFKQLFFTDMPEIVPSCNERPVISVGDVACVPYICSELFFNRVPDDTYPNVPIVALVNDRWAPPYLQQLMYLGAVVQAHAWHRIILYASYTRYTVINSCFSCTQLIS